MTNRFAFLVVLLLGMQVTPQTQEPAEVKTAFPQVLACVRANYTPEAKAAKIQGWVNVSAVVRPDGTVDDATVSETCIGHIGATLAEDRLPFRCNPPAESRPSASAAMDTLVVALEAEAVKAAKQWVFRPASRSGSPVAAGIAIQIDFDPRQVPEGTLVAELATQPNQRPTRGGGMLCAPRLNRDH